MHQALSVETLQSSQHLEEQQFRLVLLQTRHFPEVGEQVAPLIELRQEVQMVLTLVAELQLGQVGLLLEGPESFHLLDRILDSVLGNGLQGVLLALTVHQVDGR